MRGVQATLTVLHGRADCAGKAGVVGFRLGGKLAYWAACRMDAEVAVFYSGGRIEKALSEAKNIKTRLVLHIAEDDRFLPCRCARRYCQ